MAKDKITNINDTWDNYSSAGFAIEDEFLTFLKPHHPKVRRSEGKFKEYDIICDDKFCVLTHQYEKPFTYEIKRDYKSEETGNFAVEVECWGKPSGISTTTADFWVFVDSRYFWLIPTSELKMLVDKLFWRGKIKTVNGGDSNESKMYLIRKTDFQNPYLDIIQRIK